MKKHIIYIFIVTISSLGFYGCLPDKAEDAFVYKGAPVVEIKNQTLGVLATVLNAKGVYATTSQTDSSRTVLLNSRGIDSILVQLVGPQSSSPTILNYSVRSTSTAVEGTNYNFVPANARTVTIPANSSSAYIQIAMIANSLTTAGTTRTVIIDLLGNSTILPNPNYSKFLLTIRR
ncbi:MAG: hypothetical protein EOP45_03210 [Sphingobacteriaceae bacterium]|nr:MAG: hypothetical protein EOP45_03210 [Sphingobacteriaceae bacterium]